MYICCLYCLHTFSPLLFMLQGPLSLTARDLAEVPVATTCVHAPPTTCTSAMQPIMDYATSP